MTTERNMNRPALSVVMSISNEPLQWLRLAVESILCQTYDNFEFIIVCDNPGFDEGISYIRETMKKDDRIRFISNGSNLGPTRSFNLAIRTSQGEYIARMDADDISLPDRFERQVEYLNAHPEISVCATDAHTIDESGKIIRKNRYKHKKNPAQNIISNCIAHPSVMFRRNLLELRDPIYNEEYLYSQDYELWQFLILKGRKFHTLDAPLLLYRKSHIQISCVNKREQVLLFKKAHRAFITTWLKTHGIVQDDDLDDLKSMLEKASRAYAHIPAEDKEYLGLIIYILYFSLGTYSWKYRFKYLIDRNFLVFRIRFIFTFRLFVSKKTRCDRTGFN